jgi:hypothetical protein
MNIIKINSGKVELRKDNGSLIRTIGNGNAVSAGINNDQSLVVITTVNGKVEIRKENYKTRIICCYNLRFLIKTIQG